MSLRPQNIRHFEGKKENYHITLLSRTASTAGCYFLFTTRSTMPYVFASSADMK